MIEQNYLYKKKKSPILLLFSLGWITGLGARCVFRYELSYYLQLMLQWHLDVHRCKGIWKSTQVVFLFDQIIQQQWGNICTSKISFVFHLSLKKRHTSHIHFMLNSPIWRIPNSLCTVGDDRHWNLAVPDFWIPVILDGFLLTFSKHLNFLCCLHCRQESINYMYLHNFKFEILKNWGRYISSMTMM